MIALIISRLFSKKGGNLFFFLWFGAGFRNLLLRSQNILCQYLTVWLFFKNLKPMVEHPEIDSLQHWVKVYSGISSRANFSATETYRARIYIKLISWWVSLLILCESSSIFCYPCLSPKAFSSEMILATIISRTSLSGSSSKHLNKLSASGES